MYESTLSLDAGCVTLKEILLEESSVFWAVPDEINELFELPLNNRVGADCWRRRSLVVAGL